MAVTKPTVFMLALGLDVLQVPPLVPSVKLMEFPTHKMFVVPIIGLIVEGVSRRTRLLERSEKYKLPVASSHSPTGLFNLAAVARPLFPL